MDFFAQILEYRFLQHALAAAVLTGLTCGLIGTWIVSRRTVFVSGGITHASFGGIGLAWYLGWNPIVGAAIVALVASLGIEWMSSRVRVREDSAIGMVWSVGMALGVIFIFLTPGYAGDLTAILFGNILTVTTTDLVCSAVLAAITLVVFGLWMRPLMYAAFDRTFARTQGVATGVIFYGMAALTALAIVLSIRAVGVVLLISLMTFPVAIAGAFTRSFARLAVWSAAMAVAGGIAGLWASWTWNIPTGAATIFTLAIVLFAVKTLPLLFNRTFSKKRISRAR